MTLFPGSRRLARALVLACVAAMLLGAAVGASNGAEQQAKPAIRVPAPHIGDRGAYTAHLDGSYVDVPGGSGAALPFLSFEWRPGTVQRMGDGHLHGTERVQTSGWGYQGWAVAANRLREGSYVRGLPDFPVWVRHNQTLVFEQGAPTLLAAEDDLHEVRHDNATLPRTVLGGVGPVTQGIGPVQQTTVTNGTRRLFEPGSNPACLFANGLQNRTIALGEGVQLQGACDLHGLLVLGPWSLRAAAVETVQGVPALRLDPVAPFAGWLGEGEAQAAGFRFPPPTVWLADGIAYPIRISWPSAGQASPSVLELSAYQAGAQPRLPTIPPSDPAPEPTFAPAQPWGPDESGVRHPFPLSEAYLGARDDPQFPDLRDYLQSHPEAFVARAQLAVGAASETGMQRTWSFTVTDGGSWLDVDARRTDRPQAPLGLPVPLPGGAPAVPAANTTYRSEGVHRGNQYYAGLYPTPAEAPDSLPTVASLMARWQAYASPEFAARGPNAWGFQVTCLRILETACRSVWVTAWAGHQDASAGGNELDRSTTPPTLRATSNTNASLLQVSGNRTQALVESWQVADQRAGIPPAPPVTPATAAGSPAPGRSAPLAWAPTPAQAAGVGAVAAAVGLLYYLWPLAKGGLGLFSRLREPEVVAHPARRQLLQLIEAEPGIHFKEMARRTGLPNGSLVHHLETLRRGGQVVARPSGGYTLYFLGPRVPAGSAEAASALKADGARRILELVRQQPGLSSADVAARCGLQPSTVSYHVQRLQAAGLLAGLRDGRALRLLPTEAPAI